MLFWENKLLVSDELIKGKRITKLPGGGLEFCEGPVECVTREFKEETGLEVTIIEHLYTTDFFIASSFNPDKQVLCIYYKVGSPKAAQLNLQVISTQSISFRWIDLDHLSENDFTFASEKKALQALLALNKRIL